MRYLLTSTFVLFLTFPNLAFAERGESGQRSAENAVETLNQKIDDASLRIAEKLEVSDIEAEEIRTLLKQDLKEALQKGLVSVQRLEQQLRIEQKKLEYQRDEAQQELSKVRKSNDELQSLHRELQGDYSTAQQWKTALGSGYLVAFAGLCMQFLMHRRSDKLNALKVEELSRRLQDQNGKVGEQSDAREPSAPLALDGQSAPRAP